MTKKTVWGKTNAALLFQTEVNDSKAISIDCIVLSVFFLARSLELFKNSNTHSYRNQRCSVEMLENVMENASQEFHFDVTKNCGALADAVLKLFKILVFPL